MLRALVILLLLANAAFYSWTHGWLAGPLGLDPDADREPQRLQAQLHPEALRPLALASLVAPPPAAPVCLEAGPFTPVEQEQVKTAATNGLPQGSWALLTRQKPGSWLVYLGRFPNREAMLRRASDLKSQGVPYEEMKFFAGLEPGLVLGRYTVEDDAKAALQALTTQQHLRGLRLITVTPPSLAYTLRIEQADTELQTKALALREQLGGKAFVTCPKDATTAAAAASAAASAAPASAAASQP
jgi:hypothetical protein